jgi:phosphoribosylformylglycinamidine synthase
MLVVVERGFEDDLGEICTRWELDFVQIGEVTNTGRFEVYSAGEIVADVPSEDLVLGGGAPQYDLPNREPEYLSKVHEFSIDSIKEPKNLNKTLLRLLASPNIAEKTYVYRQYDSSVRSNTAVYPGSDAGVVRIKGTTKALASSTDGNGRYVYLDPYTGGLIAVAEAARNVVCAGAQPMAITNCLNFGNPTDPEIYYQFKSAVTGIGDACRALHTPVTGGNVSFYNENPKGAVYPTPVIGMLGLIENTDHITTMDFKDAGDFIVVLGSVNGELGGSEYLNLIHRKVAGTPPAIGLEIERHVQAVCLEAIRAGLVKSAHDISDGGLAVCLAESILSAQGNLGAEIHITRRLRNDELLFGESQSTIIITVNETDLLPLQRIAMRDDVPCITIGRVTDTGRLKINDLIDVGAEQMRKSYCDSFADTMLS